MGGGGGEERNAMITADNAEKLKIRRKILTALEPQRDTQNRIRDLIVWNGTIHHYEGKLSYKIGLASLILNH